MVCLSRVDRAGRTGTFQVKKRSGWARGLKVEASGKSLVGHAGAVLLHRAADRVGLLAHLRGAPGASPWMLDRAEAPAGLIVGIALRSRSVRQVELLARHHAAVLGDGASDSTLGQALGEIDEKARARIAKAGFQVRFRGWDLLAGR
jgi:hypothetical protein